MQRTKIQSDWHCFVNVAVVYSRVVVKAEIFHVDSLVTPVRGVTGMPDQFAIRLLDEEDDAGLALYAPITLRRR